MLKRQKKTINTQPSQAFSSGYFHKISVLCSKHKKILGLIALVLLCGLPLISSQVFAQAITLDLGQDATSGTVTGRIIQLLVIITVLSLAPSILIMMTSFTRIIVVLSLLRTAIGIQQTPPNTVLVALALFLTMFIMTPTLTDAYNNGLVPLINEEINEEEALMATAAPFRDFMAAHVRESDLELFMEVSNTEAESIEEVPFHVITPAFMISELRRAFEIGFMLFLPFLIIDMVTAFILMSMGMMMLPPIIISLPFKIIFFVLVDGWYLVAGSLLQSFNVPAPTG